MHVYRMVPALMQSFRLTLTDPASLFAICAEALTIEDLINYGTLNEDMATFIQASVQGRLNIVVSGGTGSGKTTLLNVLLFIQR